MRDALQRTILFGYLMAIMACASSATPCPKLLRDTQHRLAEAIAEVQRTTNQIALLEEQRELWEPDRWEERYRELVREKVVAERRLPLVRQEFERARKRCGQSNGGG